MKKYHYRPLHPRRLHEKYQGIFDPESGDVELEGTLVSSTEMTGAVPAARQEPYDENAFEEYVF